MIVLAGLVWLPIPWLAALSVATIVLHHLARRRPRPTFGSLAPIWTLLHQVGAFPFAGRVFIAPYPLVPWFAVMALGFCFGPIFARCRPTSRQRLLMRLGIAHDDRVPRWCARQRLRRSGALGVAAVGGRSRCCRS